MQTRNISGQPFPYSMSTCSPAQAAPADTYSAAPANPMLATMQAQASVQAQQMQMEHQRRMFEAQARMQEQNLRTQQNLLHNQANWQMGQMMADQSQGNFDAQMQMQMNMAQQNADALMKRLGR